MCAAMRPASYSMLEQGRCRLILTTNTLGLGRGASGAPGPCTMSSCPFADFVCELLRGDQHRANSALDTDKYVWRTGGSLHGFIEVAAWEWATARRRSKIRPIDIENAAAFRYPGQELRKAIDLVIVAAFGELQQFRAEIVEPRCARRPM